MCMLKIWKGRLNGSYVCAMFMELPKAFDTLNHNLLIAKLGDYGFRRESLSFMKSYLNDRQQIRANSNFRSWGNIITGVPQGSILSL